MKKLILILLCLCFPLSAQAEGQVLPQKKRTAICVKPTSTESLDDLSNELVERIAKKEGWYNKTFPNAKKGSIVILWTKDGNKAYVVR